MLVEALMRAGGRSREPTARTNAITLNSPGIVVSGSSYGGEQAKRLSAIYRAIDIRSGDISLMPAFLMDSASKERVPHPLLDLLNLRPNEAMAASVRKYILEASILTDGAAYDWIIRRNGKPVELIPLPGELVTIRMDRKMRPWYDVQNPITGEVFTLPNEDVCHYKGMSRNGIESMSVLGYAQATIRAGLAAQDYQATFYESGGQPSGVLTVEGDLSGPALDPKTGEPTGKTLKDSVRDEWERIHRGPDNAARVAVLDFGMKYQPLAISQKDAQFVEQQEVTVFDIARFFGVPPHMLMAGKQSYDANEQNALEYLRGLQPRIGQMEEEQSYKLLMPSERASGLEIRYNMMSVLRTNAESRGRYYQTMWQIGAYSVNDIRDLEDMPAVDGGDAHNASLNYVPLADWEQLSRNRNGGNFNENA